MTIGVEKFQVDVKKRDGVHLNVQWTLSGEQMNTYVDVF